MSTRVKPGDLMSESGPFRRSASRIILTGAALSLAMPPVSWYPLAWVGLTPLLDQWMETDSPRTAWLEASTAFLILYAVSGYWVLRHPIWESAVASLGAGLLLPFIQGIPFAAAVPVRRWKGRPAGITALVVFSLICEFVFLRSPLALPWFLVGHSQAEALPFNQFVDLTGVLGLSLWIWLLNGAAWYFMRTKTFWRSVPAALFIGLLAATYLYGDFRRGTLQANSYVSVGVVQPALPATRWADGDPARRMNRLYALSDSLLQSNIAPPDLVAWPETALPRFDNTHARRLLYTELQEWAAVHRTTLIAGTIRQRSEAARSTDLPYNSAVLFRGSEPVVHYDKRKLVPFAEGVPGAQYWDALSTLRVDAGGAPGYRQGSGTGRLSIDGMSFATQICFESLFGHLHREAFLEGASFLLVLAQNGWWGNSAGPYQHQAFTRLRAIESRRSVVLASASGTSSLIRADGKITGELDWMVPSATQLDVPIYETNTFYVRYGDWIGFSASGFALLMGLFYITRRFYRNVE